MSDRRGPIRVILDVSEVLVLVGVGQRKCKAHLTPVEARRVASRLLTFAKRASARRAVWMRSNRGRELQRVGPQ